MSGLRAFVSYGPFLFLYISMLLTMYANFQGMVSSTELGNRTDMLALLAFKDQITDDPFQVLSSWNHSLHFCQWAGVTCGRRHQRVTRLELYSLKLSGSLSASIGNLSFLRIFDISNNSLTGEVPQEVSRLSKLHVLFLANNSFQGPVLANLSGCPRLRIIYLFCNNFTGHVPGDIGSLTKLLILNYSKNFLSGSIPPSLGNISSLEELVLEENRLVGGIPESLGQLKRLNVLVLAANSLSGLVPSSLFNLTYVAEFYLAGNQFEGSLPRNLGHEQCLPNLRSFVIFQNQFSGTIPASLSNASTLFHLDLTKNKFVGGVPIDFGNMKKFYWLELGENNLGKGEVGDMNFITSLTNCSDLGFLEIVENNFGGVLPSSLANLSTALEHLNLGDNQISGNIPQGIENLVGLEMISISYNQFTGVIPKTFGKLYRLQQASLAVNQLSGWIPLSIGNLTQLSWLEMAENNLEGRIPSNLRNCSNLLSLDLGDNKLIGDIPLEVMGLSSLSINLNLSRNHLSGLIPSEVGAMTMLVELDISRNNLSGEIPTTLGACKSLARLYMNQNSFVGSIPNSMTSLRAIEEIDLSHNNLRGELPQSLATLPFLQLLDLSFNDFEGMVPLSGVFANTGEIYLIGNKKLCGGIPDLQLPKCLANQARMHKISPILKFVISLICALLGLALVLFLVLIYRKKKARNQPHPTFSLLDPFVNLSYGDIFKATDGFSSLNLIGSGNFGSVYRGILELEKQIVAIKLLNLQAKGATRSFKAECEAIRNIRHRNLVKVITCCSSMDYHGNDFKAIVYEFMQNGSLESWLHPPLHAGEAICAESKTLSFSQRLNVIIDVAAALDYLHNHCEVPIIHRNLHPSNILLDNNMTAHVTDFGLAKMVEQCDNEMLPTPTGSSCCKGRIGYASPEYGIGCSATTLGDVYSFGIIILETFAGKSPTDEMLMDSLNLHNMAKMALQTGVVEIVDRALLCEIERKKAPLLECLTAIFEIGVACSEELPRNRPNISNVANEIRKIKTQLLKHQNTRHA